MFDNNLTAKNLTLTLERSQESCIVYAVMTKWVSLSVEPAGKNWSSIWKWFVKVQSNDAIFHPIFSFNMLSTKIIMFDPVGLNVDWKSDCVQLFKLFSGENHGVKKNCLIKLFVKSCCVITPSIDSSRLKCAIWFKIGRKIASCDCTFIVHPLCL